MHVCCFNGWHKRHQGDLLALNCDTMHCAENYAVLTYKSTQAIGGVADEAESADTTNLFRAVHCNPRQL